MTHTRLHTRRTHYRVLAVVLTFVMAVALTVSAAPSAEAQDLPESVTGTVLGGTVPLADVAVSVGSQSAITGPDGVFAVPATPAVNDLSLNAAQTAGHPEFSLAGTSDLGATPLTLELPEVVQVEFTVQGGYYTDCSYDNAIIDGCVIDELCTPELASAGLCDEVFVEIRSSVDTGDFTGQWSSVGETIDNRVTLPIFAEPGLKIYAFTVDAGVTEFVWNGSTSMVLDLDDPNPEGPVDPDLTEVTVTVLAGAEPLIGVSVYTGSLEFEEFTTDANGQVTIVAPAGEPITGPFTITGPDDYVLYPYFRADVMVEDQPADTDFDIVLPAIDRVEVRVNDAERPGHLPDAGEFRIRVLDNLVAPNLGSGSNWAVEMYTVGGVATIPVFVDASGPDYPSTFFIGAQAVADFDIGGQALFTGADPTFIDVQAPPYAWYFDADGDLFGDDSVEPVLSEFWPGPGYEPMGGDCDDDDAAINPLATEIPDNGIDENCDGVGAEVLPQLEIRFDIVRENGEICSPDFASATPGVGDALLVDDGEEITLCFKVINNGPGGLVDVTVDHPDLVQPLAIGELGEGEEAGLARDRLVNTGDGVSTATVTARTATETELTAQDQAAVEVRETTATIGDFVWDDTNGNGIQDVAEPGIEGATVVVWSTDAAGDLVAVVDSLITDEFGAWQLEVPAGDYRVSFVLPFGASDFSPQDVGDDAADSDVIGSGAETGFTPIYSVSGGSDIPTIDAGIVFPSVSWFVDLDGDGYGDDDVPVVVAPVSPGPSYIEQAGDCDDSDAAINPDASEIAGNLVDENCDGEIAPDGSPALISIGDYEVDTADGLFTIEVELLPALAQPVYAVSFDLLYDPSVVTPVLQDDSVDVFLEGLPTCGPGNVGCGPRFPNGTLKVFATGPGTGWTDLTTVMLLEFMAVGEPGTSQLTVQNELALDTDIVSVPVNALDGTATVVTLLDWYLDIDADGFGDQTSEPLRAATSPGLGYVADNTDCNDAVAAINPNAIEIPGNDVDENCDGVTLRQAYCFGQAVTIDMRTGAPGIGTNNDDVILGTTAADTIKGRGGDDVICSGAGDDIVFAGSGDDLVFSGGGDDTVYGGRGNDDLRGGAGNDVLLGQSDNDVLRGGSGDDDLRGQHGDDILAGGQGNDALSGGRGADVLRGSSGADFLRGNAGDDRLIGGSGNDALVGGSGFDVLNGGADIDACSDSRQGAVYLRCEDTGLAIPV